MAVGLVLIRPSDLESFRHISVGTTQELYYRTHLSVYEGVSQDDLLLLDIMIDTRDFRDAALLPTGRERAEVVLLDQPLFIIL